MPRILVLSLLCWFLTACSSNEGVPIPEKPVYSNSNPTDTAFAPLRPVIQSFEVDNKAPATIVAAGGTRVFIPADCFTDSKGRPAEGKVEIQVVEAFSLADFISSGLVTLSGDRLLVSNGMMYINARSANQPLQLAPGASLSVSMRTMGDNSGFSLFTGDGRNWAPDSSAAETGYAMPLPLNLLYPEGNKILWNCIENSGDKNEKWHLLDTTIISVTNPKYENTVIATREFQNRFYVIRTMMEWMAHLQNDALYFDKPDACSSEAFNYELLKIYFDHPTRSFRESDSLARKTYLDYFKANKEKMIAFFDRVNQRARKYYSNYSDTDFYFDFRKHSLEEQYMEPLKWFSFKGNTELKIPDMHGVNPEDADAVKQLQAKGVEAKEINEIMSWQFRRQTLVRQLQRDKTALLNKQKVEQLYESTVFSITVMGWINCDLFLDDPAAGKAELYVSNGSATHLGFMDCSLVIPDINARLSAYVSENGGYSFTRPDGRYTKLPIGKEAIVVGVALQHDSLFFASRRIRISAKQEISLPMQFIRRELLKDSMRLALK